jgi:hypothetical protein
MLALQLAMAHFQDDQGVVVPLAWCLSHDGRLSPCAPLWIQTLWVPPQDQVAHPLPPNRDEKLPLQHGLNQE